ncbi:MAG: M12 family metallo-peptidase [Methanoregula sp.]|nr:M12 family metallo-peptidase [Methanoregula sp.]
MTLNKFGVVLLALLLAAMAMVPMVSAEERFVSKGEILDMEYLTDNPISEMRETLDSQATSGRLDTLSEYALVTVDPKAFMDNADKKKQVAFTIKGTKYVLNLESIPSPIDKNTNIYTEGPNGELKTDVPLMKTYKGSVKGIKKSDALFTVSNDVILGYIMIDETTYVLDQMGPGLRNDGKTVHVIYNNAKKIVNPEAKVEDLDVHLTAEPAMTDARDSIDLKKVAVAASTTSTTTIDLLVVVDSQFRQNFSDPIAEINNRISAANSAFSPAEASFYVRSIRQDSSLTNTGTEGLLGDFRSAYSQKKVNDICDVALLLTGKSLSGSLAGSYIYNGYTNAAWTVVQMVPRSSQGYSATPYQRSILITHELGHTVGALHIMPDGSQPSPLWARPTSWADGSTTKYTVMSEYFRGDAQQLQFSTSSWWPLGYHGDANHDNRKAIIEDKTTVAAFN